MEEDAGYLLDEIAKPSVSAVGERAELYRRLVKVARPLLAGEGVSCLAAVAEAYPAPVEVEHDSAAA
jgi:hypothetical protein